MSAIVYSLSMPGSPSWNGRWSGEGRCYAIVKPIRPTKKHTAKCQQIADGGPYSFRWNDGWCASVSVRIVDGAEARKIRRASQGFCGYNWMVDSIERFGRILDTPQQREAEQGAAP